MEQTCNLEEYIEKLTSKLFALKSHSFIAKAQNKYLQSLKETLQVNQAIAILDFSENYSFVVQDEVQGFHWNKNQCTIHPVAIYWNDGNKVNEKSMCIFSDDLIHDDDFVFETTKIICKNLSQLTNKNVDKLFYFSDGCAGQYKNCKNLINLTNHKKKKIWNTSHGKNSCDGIGGSIKRSVQRASLQRPQQPILDAFSAF